MRFTAGLLGVLLLASAARGAVIEVEGPQDTLAGAPLFNHCTLRKAIINANTDTALYPECAAGSGADTILFLAPWTINFGLVGILEDEAEEGDLDVTDDLTVTGHPGGTVVNAAGLDRVFDVKPGVTFTLNDIHLRNGIALGSGGAIVAQEATLNLNRVTISASDVMGGDGGAIYALGSVVHLNNSTLTGNTADHHGGAMVIDGGTATISHSTISGNSSGFSNLTGGIRSTGATTLRNTIVAGNGGVDLPNLDGLFTSLGYNVIGELGSNPANPAIAPAAGDQLDVVDASVNLGPLAANGGPTRTRALLPGSIALDRGHSGGETADQRGATRPCDNVDLANAAGGDGADVGAFEEAVLCVTESAPDAFDDAASVVEDSAANPIAALANDVDADGDALTITAVTQGAHGTVAFSAESVSYTPNANFFGSDSFTYTIGDGNGGSDTATVSVTVTSVNDTPAAAGEAYSMNQNTTLHVPAPGVLGNDSDIDSDPLTAVLDTGASHGMVVLASDGSFTYTPDSGFAGSDSFRYVAYDGTTWSNTVTVTVDVADTQAPTITASLALSQLWPPNNKLADVGLLFSAADNSSGVSTQFAVYSDEPAGTADDAVGMLRLRAERDGSGDGRVYLIRISATDAYSNTSDTCLTVTVPKSLSAKHVADVNAQAAAAQAQCTGAGMFAM